MLNNQEYTYLMINDIKIILCNIPSLQYLTIWCTFQKLLHSTKNINVSLLMMDARLMLNCQYHRLLCRRIWYTRLPEEFLISLSKFYYVPYYVPFHITVFTLNVTFWIYIMLFLYTYFKNREIFVINKWN